MLLRRCALAVAPLPGPAEVRKDGLHLERSSPDGVHSPIQAQVESWRIVLLLLPRECHRTQPHGVELFEGGLVQHVFLGVDGGGVERGTRQPVRTGDDGRCPGASRVALQCR